MMTSDRLYPPKWHHARVILDELRRTLEPIGARTPGQLAIDFGSGSSPYRPLFRQIEDYRTADLPGMGADLTIQAGTIPMDAGSADLVLSTQVLEHVPDPVAYLREARRILSPEGALVLSTHGHYRYHPDPEDYWRWTEPGLRRVLGQSGFVVTEAHPVLSGPGASLTMFCQFVGEPLPRPLRALFHVLAQTLISGVERVARRRQWRDAAVFVVVATPALDGEVPEKVRG
jgi:SAM-dependent methyltransferase